jgi:iron complex outermembrane receptor protein
VPGACQAQLKQQSGNPYAAENDLAGAESYLRQEQVINTTTWHASDNLTVKNIANYTQLLTGLDSALFGTNFVCPRGTTCLAGSFPVYGTTSDPTAAGGLTTDQYTWSDELQLQGRALGDKLTWQGGGYIERSGPLGDVTGSRSASFLSCSDIATFQCTGFGNVGNAVSTIHYSDLAIFGQATYAILDNLKLTGGARYTSDTTTSTFGQINYGGPGLWPATFGSPLGVSCVSSLQGGTVANGCVQSYRQNSNSPTYLVDLDYTPIEDTMIYGKYSRGYRQGGIATFVADGYHLFKPEYVNAFEIGEKTTFRGPVPGIFNLAAFYNDFTNQQLLVGFTGPIGVVTPSSGIANAGTSHIWGAEMETAITPVKPLTVGISYTYLRTELISETALPLPTGGYNQIIFPSVAGGELPYSPKNKVSANATYKLPVSEHLGALSLGAIFTYTSRSLVSDADPLYAYIAPYGLLDLNMNWNSIAGSTVDASLFATNVLDRAYFNNVTQLYNTEFGIDSRYIGEPRMYGLRVRIRFGGN